MASNEERNPTGSSKDSTEQQPKTNESCFKDIVVRGVKSQTDEERCLLKVDEFIQRMWGDMLVKSSPGRRAVQYSSKESTDQQPKANDVLEEQEKSSNDMDTEEQENRANDLEQQEKRRACEEIIFKDLMENICKDLNKAKSALEEVNPQWINFFQELDKFSHDFEKESENFFLESSKVFQDLKTEFTARRAIFRIWRRAGSLLFFGSPIAMLGWIIYCKKRG